MKQLLNKISILFFGIFIFLSCNDDDTATSNLNVNVNIANDETYEFIIGGYDSKSIIEIIEQPNNFQYSSIDYEQNPKRAYYRYIPTEGFTGQDEAKIYFKDVLSDEDGFRVTAKTYIKFNIKVE